jgi:hypothetical protein
VPDAPEATFEVPGARLEMDSRISLSPMTTEEIAAPLELMGMFGRMRLAAPAELTLGTTRLNAVELSISISVPV